MTVRKKINDKTPSKVQNPTKANWDTHKSAPKITERHVFEVRRVAILSVTGAKPKVVAGELDLESGKCEVSMGVAPNEFIKIKSGNGVLDLAFTHIDEHGRLAFMLFNNKRYEGNRELSIDEGESHLTYISPNLQTQLEIKIQRLPLLPPENGKIANVRIWAEEQKG